MGGSPRLSTWIVPSCLCAGALFGWLLVSRRRPLAPPLPPVGEVVLPSLEHCEPPPPEVADLLVVFGSESGTAEQLAAALSQEANFQGVSVLVQTGSEFAASTSASAIVGALAAYKAVALILATAGQGDPAKNFSPMQKMLEDAVKRGAVAGVSLRPKISCLGLGDSSYRRFCGSASDTTDHLQKLGVELAQPLARIDAKGSTPADTIFGEWADRILAAVAPPGGARSTKMPAALGTFRFIASLQQIAAQPFPLSASRSEPTARRPALCKVLFARDLVAPPSEASLPSCSPVLHIGVDISSNDTLRTYQAGDHLGIFPTNPPELVARALDVILSRQDGSRDWGLGGTLRQLLSTEEGRAQLVDGMGVELCTNANEKARASLANTLPARVPLRQVFSAHLDLSCPPRRSLLRMLGRCCDDDDEREALMEGRLCDALHTVVDVLEAFPSCRVPLDLFVEAAPKMAPRLYSIASDPTTHPNHIEILVKVVPGGLASTFLHTKRPGEAVFAFVRRSTFHISPKAMRKTPSLLIGPGTGLAPLAGFLHRRFGYGCRSQHNQPPLAPCYLYFGCRHTAVDFILRPLFQPPPEAILAPWGALSDDIQRGPHNTVTLPIHVALSRQVGAALAPPLWNTGSTARGGGRGAYVQDLLWENREQLCRSILGCQCGDSDEGEVSRGAVYICGDAAAMAKDVEATLRRILVECAGMSEERAADHLAMMAKSERFFLDVW